MAKIIECEDVKEVCFMSLYAVVCLGEDTPIHSKERQQSATNDILVVSSLDYKLNEKEYVFDGDLMANPQYVAYIMKNELKNRLDASKLNMFPIWQAFRKKMPSATSDS